MKRAALAVICVVTAAPSMLFMSSCADDGGASHGSDGSTSATTDAASCDPSMTPTVGDLPDDVNAVLTAKCQTCHQSPPKNHAPFPLLSFEGTQLQFGITTKRKWQRMAEVIEPGAVPHMPYGNAPQLTDAELATLRQWFAGCAQPVAEGKGHDQSDDGGPEHP